MKNNNLLRLVARTVKLINKEQFSYSSDWNWVSDN